MKSFTTNEIKLAKAGYCYHRFESNSGQRRVVYDLKGVNPDKVMFDKSAYDTHREMGIV